MTKAPYLSLEKSRGLWRYQRPVPRALQGLYGAKLIRKWLGTDKRAAEATARALAAEHDSLFDHLTALPQEQQSNLAALGGYVYAELHSRALSMLFEGKGETPWLSPAQMFRVSSGVKSEADAALILYKAQQQEKAAHAHLKHATSFVLKSAHVKSDRSWDALHERWKVKSRARHKNKPKATLALLRECFGERDYTTITPHDAEHFLTWMAEQGISVPMQHKHREAASGMFSQAVPLVMAVHPFKSVTVAAEYNKAKKHPYEGSEVQRILDMLGIVGIGRDYRTESLWAVRIAAFQGCRVSEACQLQRGDIGVRGGVPVIYFRALDAVTEKPNPQKHIKTGEDRCVAMHPALWDSSHPLFVGDLRKYAKGERSKFLFARFGFRDPAKGGKGWGEYLINNMGRFVRHVCGITRPNIQPNHAFRHRMNDAMINAGWPEDRREAFLGQGGGINRRYGDGKALALMSKDMRAVNPLADVLPTS